MESISKSATRTRTVRSKIRNDVLLAGAVPLYYLRVGRIEGLRDMFYALEYEPYKKGILCCTFADFSLYTFRKNDDYNRG